MERKIMGRSQLALGLVILALSANCVNAITCTEAVATLTPCIPFVTGIGGRPSVPCCSSVKTVNDKAATKEDRRELCKCLKRTGPALRVKPEKDKQIPGLCGILVPVPIDPIVDCNTIG